MSFDSEKDELYTTLKNPPINPPAVQVSLTILLQVVVVSTVQRAKATAVSLVPWHVSPRNENVGKG